MELTSCPECGSIAEVTCRFELDSTDGPVEHVRLRCLQRHWFLCPAASLVPESPRRSTLPPGGRGDDQPFRRRTSRAAR
jgi:hypothetical protein